MLGRHAGPAGALQRGDTVDLPLYGLPAWARVGEALHWRRRAVVSADGPVVFRDDDGAAWLAENELYEHVSIETFRRGLDAIATAQAACSCRTLYKN